MVVVTLSNNLTAYGIYTDKVDVSMLHDYIFSIAVPMRFQKLLFFEQRTIFEEFYLFVTFVTPLGNNTNSSIHEK